jgi:hypothetical protein
MMLFNRSPPFSPAADFLNVSSHAGAVRTPADKANVGIRTAGTAGGIFRQGHGILCRRAGRSGACFFFWCYIMLHSSAPFFKKNKKGAAFSVRQRLIVLLFSCMAHSNLLQ